MSEPADHLDAKEATEARLCAYLEGTLLPTERVEIERHLLANPQHKRLLAELATTREWTRMLPFENVPIDLAEAFQGQVERSLLLDDAEDRGTQVRRWPQVMLIAATVVITLGLGTLIWTMLPGRGLAPLAGKYAAATRPEVMDSDPPPLAVAPIGEPPAPAGTAVASVGGRRPAAKEMVAVTANSAPARKMFLTVTTDRPDEVVRETQMFFSRNNVLAESSAVEIADATPTGDPGNSGGGGGGVNQIRNNSASNVAPRMTVAQTMRSAERELVFRRVSRSAVAGLRAELSVADPKRTVTETADPSQDLKKGQLLTVTVPELVGPGIEKTNVVSVAADGTISLPMIDPVPAEGMTAAALATSIADKYKQANLIPKATVSVKPTTAPAAKADEATTQPADDRPVDLVVRVQPATP